MSLLHFAVLGLTARGPEGITRRRVFEAIRRFPGLHQRELARQLEMRPGHAEHHLRHLERAGLVHRQVDGRYVRYYAAVTTPGETGVGRLEKPVLAMLRQARPLEVVARLLQGESEMQDLAKALGVGASTLSYHVKRLEAARLVKRWRDGQQQRIALADREGMIGILLAYEPPADLVAGFEELLDDVTLP